MKIIGIAIIGTVLLLLLMDKTKIKKLTENLSVFWFRLAFAFLALFILNIAGGFVGIYFPVNVASGFLLAILGIPGFAALIAFAVFL
ncbi:pro-sigmaK processing inhibitor BofA family protein [Sporosarcina highlanderae]|uniref:Pro-sigmaK processing inhibitor BofA family protein n=1 Tax=Sporosarcina highlanderae TaxID=3035916 RepID=A0ABT8JYH2_9BACL|nr:pro-sigmaK processing inhibitor BofA family protein [Sporosarcina highlanderae]MDN4609194.1 pro-sigmaK processing inhibitor BofA family protein [Sporosarcina highlanderae]